MSDTLKAMQEAGLADDNGELTTPGEEGELETEIELEPEAVVAEGEDEVEVVLGDEQAAPKKELEPGVKKTLTHLRRDRRELREQNSGLSTENESLRAELNALKAATLQKPRYSDYPTDEAYETALLQYHSLMKQPAPAPAAQPNQPQSQQGPDFSESVNAHYERAEKLGVNLGKFEQAERNVRTQLGDVLTDALIDAVGAGSEKAVMLIGTNPAEMTRLQSLLASDPSGLKAVSHLGRLSERVKLTKNRVSGAPKPTRSPSGGGAVPMGTLEKQLAAAEKSGDANRMFKARRAISKAKRAASSQ